MILPGQGSYLNPQFVGKDVDTTITGYVTDLTLDWLKTKGRKENLLCSFICIKRHIDLGGLEQISLQNLARKHFHNLQTCLMIMLQGDLLLEILK